MADLERIKRDISEIAGRRKAVRFSEIERIVHGLGRLGFPIRSRRGKEAHLFGVGSQRFNVCPHNPGSKHVKFVYVDVFLNAMAALGLYEEE